MGCWNETCAIDETALHMIVAKFIIDNIQETAVDKKDGDAETIYFFK